MKRIAMFFILACVLCAVAFAQQSYYVSAKGDANNDGLTESKPLRSLYLAFGKAATSSIKRITVIGTLNEESDILTPAWKEFCGSVFLLDDDDTQEITITGKPGANNANRAILSAKGSSAGVLVIDANVRIRFEHIEISGGESEEGTGFGLIIDGGASVTLGTGAIIRNNREGGIAIHEEGTCIIDGGEIRDNQGTGVVIHEKSVLTMRNGTIRDNRGSSNGGGVFVAKDGRFTMTGGTITANSAVRAGGGVCSRQI